MSARIEPLLAIEDLDALPDDGNRYELIEGELFVSRAPAIPHQFAVQNLQVALSLYLRENPIGKVVPGAGAVFSKYDAVIPDLCFVRNERWAAVVSDVRFTAAPDIVIEVLSPGAENRQRDLSVKRQLYAKYGVAEYWVIDAENRSVEIYGLSGQTLACSATLLDVEEITSPLLPGFALAMSAIFNF